MAAYLLSQNTLDRIMRVVQRVESWPVNTVGATVDRRDSYRPPVPRMCIGKLTAASTKGSTGTMTIYSGTGLGEASTSDVIGFVNLFGNVSSGVWGFTIAVNATEHYLISAECT